MNKFFTLTTKVLIIIFLTNFCFSKVYSDEIEIILQQIQEDIKTLEKAVYSQDINNTSNTRDLSSRELSSEDSDILTKHLLKLSELEEQFKILTNNFEEINFKLDKLSNRITKVQTDNQMRFQDLEKSGLNNNTTGKEKKKLPGSDEQQDLGGVSDSDIAAMEQIQRTQSIETVGTVVTETTSRAQKILPNKNPEEQYEFAVSFIKVGDYETAELALREFVDTNPAHKLAGNAQYWYGETFRVRQLYQDAASAYLDGYQKYPKSSKAPVNLLKLGVMLVQIGEKEQGCSMILGIKDQYPKANQSVIQKAEYEKKKFSCKKKS
jgi:tol-pal system protein YbgF